MRMRELQEAEGFSDFSKQATDVIDSITKAAGGAFNRFKGAKEKAESNIKSDIQDERNAAEKAAEKAEKAAGSKAKSDKAKLGESIPDLVAKVVVDRTPDDPDMIEEFHALGVEQFNSVYAAIDKAKERLSKFPREMRKALKASDFLQAQSKADNELNDMLGEQPDKGMEPAEDMLMKNLYDEQELWVHVLTSDDAAGAAQEMISLIKAISRDFEKRNLAGTGGAGRKKNFPEGTGIVRIMSTQRQLLAIRLNLLHGSVEQLASKPVTEAALRRVRKLLERME